MEPKQYVEAMFKAMPIEQLVQYINEYVIDPFCFKFPSIYNMDDEENWNRFRESYDFEDILKILQDAINSHQFDRNRKYWMFFEDGDQLYSFTTTEELMSVISLDTLCDTFFNMEYEYSNVRKGENEHVWWADIYKCDILVATACVVLPIGLSTTMVLYREGKPYDMFSIYQGSRPSGWEQDDFFKDAVSILNDNYPFIPWMPNKAGMFHAK